MIGHVVGRVVREANLLPAARYLSYVSRLEGRRVGDCSAALRRTRAVKSEWELERMRIAAGQVRAAAEAVPTLIGPGVAESQVQLEVERVLRLAGHQGQLRFRGFNQEMHYGQVLGGPSGAVPGYSDSPLCGPGPNAVLGKGPDGHLLATGDPVIVDLVGGHEGYLARTQAAPGPGPTGRLLTSLPASTGPPRYRACAALINSGQRPPVQSLTVDLYPIGLIRHGADYDPVAVAALAAIGVLLIGMAQP